MENNILLSQVLLKFKHHNNYSGYDVLNSGFNDCRTYNLEDYFLWDFNSYNYLYRFLNKTSFNLALFNLENQLIKESRHDDLIHFLYPENTLAYFDKFEKKFNKGTKIFSSFHQPVKWWEDLKFRPRVLDNLKNTNFSICLSSNQSLFVKEYLETDNVRFIPHGVYTDFYLPDFKKTRDHNNILVVGSWLRDFPLLIKVIEKCKTKYPNLYFSIVAESNKSREFNRLDNVKFYSNISNDSLIDLYNTCSFLFLPLLDSVANNALLEALSCGTPILISKIGGVLDYTNDSCVFYLENEINEILVQIDRLANDLTFKNSLALSAREQSLKFDWSLVINEVRKYYNESLLINN